jgi:hypothetical protein
MDQGRFEAWTRRRVGWGLSGLVAGLVSLGQGGESAAKAKKCPKCPKIDTCPQVMCCSCGFHGGCFYLPTSPDDLDADCAAACPPGTTHNIAPSDPKVMSGLCDADDLCVRLRCPLIPTA